MALETATYIDGLNASNPTATDQVSIGDDHLRLLKSTIKASWPNISGAVNANQTELNYLDGVTGTTGTGNLVLSAAPTLTGAATATGTLDVTGALTAASFTGSIAAANIDAGVLANAVVGASNVVQHQAALTITESQISDLQSYLISGSVATTLSIGNADTTLSRDGAGQLAVEGAAVFTHNDGALTSGKIFFSNGTEPTTEGSNGDIFLVY